MLRDRCRKAVDELVLAAWENEVRTCGPHWVRCSELLAAYGYGKPKERLEVQSTVEVRPKWNPGAYLPEELEQLERVLEKGQIVDVVATLT